MTMRRRNFVMALIFIPTLPIVLVIFLLIGWSVFTSDREREFDSQEWKEDEFNRAQMIDDIISEDILKGKTKNEVTDMLGSKEITYSDSIWVYDAGIIGGFPPEAEVWLEIEFSNNIVTNVTRGEVPF